MSHKLKALDLFRLIRPLNLKVSSIDDLAEYLEELQTSVDEGVREAIQLSPNAFTPSSVVNEQTVEDTFTSWLSVLVEWSIAKADNGKLFTPEKAIEGAFDMVKYELFNTLPSENSTAYAVTGQDASGQVILSETSGVGNETNQLWNDS